MLFSPFFCFNCLLFLTCLLLDFSRVSSGHVFVVSLFRCCQSPDRRLCLFIVDFNSKSCKLKLVKWGFLALLVWPTKQGERESSGNCFETVSIAEVISSTESRREKGTKGGGA